MTNGQADLGGPPGESDASQGDHTHSGAEGEELRPFN